MTARSIFDYLDNSPVPSPTSWAGRRPPSPAMARSCAKLEEQASRTARTLIKERARVFLNEPQHLDSLRYGFIASGMTPAQLIEFAKELLRITAIFHRCEIVPIQKINAKAAIVAGRWSRRVANRIARKSA